MSVKAEASITIDRPPEAVFAVLTDVVSHPGWSKGAGRVLNVSENPAVLGTTWTQITRLFGKEVEGHAKVVQFEANRKFGAEMDKPFPGQMLWQIESNGNGAKVTVSSEIEPGGFLGVAGPLVAKTIKDSFSSDLSALKAQLEAPA